MDQKKRARLEAAGWKVGTVQDFLELSDAESAMIESAAEAPGEEWNHAGEAGDATGVEPVTGGKDGGGG
jgi:hypothetical protein